MNCSRCTNDFEMPAERCPHCAEPCPYVANVWAASRPEDVSALERRYQAALQDAATRGCALVVQAFEAKLSGSKAVIARHLHDVERLAFSDKEVHATFHLALDAGMRLPDGDAWNELRIVAERALFPRYEAQIRFAVLSLDDLGPLSYGAWSITLRTPMIERRASTFEENNLIFTRNHKVPIDGADAAFRGFRATWANRGKLGIAKLGGAITATTQPSDFAGLLLQQVGGTGTDEFIEVHIWGPMTMRTAEKVVLTKTKDSRRLAKKSRVDALRESLKKLKVDLEVRA